MTQVERHEKIARKSRRVDSLRFAGVAHISRHLGQEHAKPLTRELGFVALFTLGERANDIPALARMQFPAMRKCTRSGGDPRWRLRGWNHARACASRG
jgi:hypothetical protein